MIAEGETGPGHGQGPGSARALLAWRPVLSVAAVVALVHLAVATRFGWHRDEFYYVVAGRHPAFGYVDQPPLAPLLARLAAAGGGVLPLRLLAIAAQVGCAVLAAALAAEFGGRRRAQVVAAAAVGSCPVFVGASVLFGTTVLDQLAWSAVFVLVARALRLGGKRAWLVAGIVAGLGLETKDTLAVLVVGIAVGLALFHRDVLRTAGPWLAGAAAVALAVPNLMWDAQHGWANLKMAAALAGKVGGPLGSLAQLPALPLVLAGPPLIALWVAGVRWLLSPQGRAHRWVLTCAVAAVLLFTVGGGKVYYAAPILTALFAAGAVRVEARYGQTGRGLRRSVLWPAAIIASAATSVVFLYPVLPVSTVSAIQVSPDLMETYGWPQFVDQVAKAAAPLPADTPIFTSNYGEAGALTILGPAHGLHHPIVSGHNNYTFWGPPPGSPDTVIAVGEWGVHGADYLHRFWSQVHEIAPITLPGALRNQETKNDTAIYLCQQPRGTWTQLWPALRHYD
jgi:4-amino-4-deoxy-L-arabinose transferase-like glycosyltransferase